MLASDGVSTIRPIRVTRSGNRGEYFSVKDEGRRGGLTSC